MCCCRRGGNSLLDGIVVGVGRSGAWPTSSGSNGRDLAGMMKSANGVTNYQLDYEL